jgi:hypothetical protein
MTIPFFTIAQSWDCSSSTIYKEQVLLKLNLNAGITSYFGDLSIYDLNPPEKVTKESLPGFGFIASVQLNKTFSLSGQFLQANLRSEKEEISFRTNVYEYNLHLGANLLNLLRIPHNPDFGFEGYAGVGQFFYSVTKETVNNFSTDITTYPDRVPEFVYFFGGGFSYRFTKYTSLTLDLAIRQCQTDRLDDVIRNDDFDYYSYFSAGLTVDVGRLINPFVKTKYVKK